MPSDLSLEEVLNALEKALAVEKAALLRSAFDVVGAVLSEKEKLSAQLDRLLVDKSRAAQLPAYRTKIKKIVELANENEKLLETAKMGVAAAHSRIKEILNRQTMVGVYAEGGDKVLTPGAGVSRQKFA